MSAQKPGVLVFEAPRRGKPPRHLADLSLAERKQALTDVGLPGFRAAQLSKHYFDRLEDDPQGWTDIPAAQREQLPAGHAAHADDRRCASWRATTARPARRCGGCIDGALVESVLMRYPDRITMCVSSQAGCGMNCPFCATGQAGLTRNMSTAEIVEQVVAGARTLARGEVAGRSGPRSPTSCSWAWASRWRTTRP